MKPLYCIIHNEWTFSTNYLISDYSNCVLTTCPPPELPEGWEDVVEHPTPDEMIEIDQNAIELALDLELI